MCCWGSQQAQPHSPCSACASPSFTQSSVSPFPKLTVMPEIWEMGMLMGTVTAAHFFPLLTPQCQKWWGCLPAHLGSPAGAVKVGFLGCMLWLSTSWALGVEPAVAAGCLLCVLGEPNWVRAVCQLTGLLEGRRSHMGLSKVSCAQGLPSPHPVSCVPPKPRAELQERLAPPNRPVCSAGLAHLSLAPLPCAAFAL